MCKLIFLCLILCSLALSDSRAVSAQQFGRQPYTRFSAIIDHTISAQQFGRQPYTRFAVIVDHTISAEQKSVPSVQAEDIKPLTETIMRSGGDIGIIAVRASAKGGLLRFHINPPTSDAPAPPDETALKKVSIFERRRRWVLYNQKLQNWKKEEAQRRAETAAGLKQFEAELSSMLQAPRTERRSDVFGALMRLDRFLNEPAPEPGYPVCRALLICSDLVDTKSGQVYTLTSAPITAWLFREITPQGRIKGVAPVMFESTQPAIEWLSRQCGGGGN
jgi:hypothetical protein